MLAPNFSDTNMVEEVACQVTIMDMLPDYSEYEMHTCCGFPSITLEGKVEDWRTLRKDADVLIREKMFT